MKARRITFSALLAALIFVVTWLVSIPVPGGGGAYLNLGDAMIYLSAGILGGPMGFLAAGIGSTLADIAYGSFIYAVPTFVIKGLMGFCFGAITAKPGFLRYFLAALLCGGIMTAGYFAFEAFVFGLEYAFAAAIGNLAQWFGSVVAALALYRAAIQLKKLLNRSA